MLSIFHVFIDRFYIFFGEMSKMCTFKSKVSLIMILELYVKEKRKI